MNLAPTGDDERNYFAISVGGPDFDVDQYPAGCPFTIARVWRRGEPWPPGTTIHKISGFHIDLGRGAELSIEEQQEIAADFLEQHAAALIALKAIPTVESFYLGLQEEVLRESAGSIFDLDPRLMQAALKIGIQLTVWACLERKTGSS